MRKSPRILLIAFFALGTQGAVAGAGDHPLPVETLWNDFDSYARLLEFSWANRGFHERADRFDLDLKIAGMKSSFSRSPPATPQVFYLAVKKFSVSLHDGHLYAMFPRAEGAAAESQFSFAFAREGVVLTACRWDCEGVPLPAMVASIDGLPTEDWLRERAESSAGSTAFGRRHHALEDLSRYAGLRGEWTPPARLGVVLNSGTAKTLPFVWRQGTPPAPPAEPCIASSLLEGALVLRVRTFVCREAGESDPALWDKRFIAQMDQALNRPEPFGKILVDLRNNGGGMPGEAIPLAGHFLKAKTLYYRSRDLTRPDPALFDTFVEPDSLPRYGNDGELWSKPLWLLTDGGCFRNARFSRSPWWMRVARKSWGLPWMPARAAPAPNPGSPPAGFGKRTCRLGKSIGRRGDSSKEAFFCPMWPPCLPRTTSCRAPTPTCAMPFARSPEICGSNSSAETQSHCDAMQYIFLIASLTQSTFPARIRTGRASRRNKMQNPIHKNFMVVLAAIAFIGLNVASAHAESSEESGQEFSQVTGSAAQKIEKFTGQGNTPGSWLGEPCDFWVNQRAIRLAFADALSQCTVGHKYCARFSSHSRGDGRGQGSICYADAVVLGSDNPLSDYSKLGLME